MRDLNQFIQKYVKKHYLPKRIKKKSSDFNHSDYRFYAPHISRLSDYYKGLIKLPKNYLNDPRYRAAYLLYFLPVNYLKVSTLLGDNNLIDHLPENIRLCDFGSGPGTASLSTIEYLDKMKFEGQVECMALDQSSSALDDLKSLSKDYFKESSLKLNIQTKNFDFRKKYFFSKKNNLLFLANALNELPTRESQYELVSRLFNEGIEKNNSFLIIIEPALRKTSRDLQWLRDQLIERDGAHLWAPCTHENTCPLNQSQRDWCHFYMSWSYPEPIKKFDQILGFKKPWLACSYLILSHQKKQKPKHLARVISNQIHSKGKKEILFCNENGALRLAKLNKFNNSNFDNLRRGDLVDISFAKDIKEQKNKIFWISEKEKIKKI